MIHLPSYLQQSRHGVFYLRIVIPQDLRPLYGKREIKLSLKTRIQQTAMLASLPLTYRIKRQFEFARERYVSRKPTSNDIKWAKAYDKMPRRIINGDLNRMDQ